MRRNEAKWLEKQSRWQINVQRDGTRRSFYSSVKGKRGKLEAERKADRWLASDEVENVKVGTMLERWLEDLSLRVSPGSYRSYDKYARVYLSELENKNIRSVTEVDLQRIIDRAYKERNLSYRTLAEIKGVCGTFFKYCRMSNVTTLRPEGLTVPKQARRPHKQIAQPEDLTILFSNKVKDRYLHAYRFAILTGLRPGELLGLQWGDIKHGTVSIMRAVTDRDGMTQGKNANANRTFKLSARAAKELDEQKKMLKREGISSVFVFPDQTGRVSKQVRYREAWYAFCDRYGIKRITPYEMRHTFVSVADDLPEGLKKKMVGHSRSMDTEGVYGHRKRGDMDRTAALIDEAFDRIL